MIGLSAAVQFALQSYELTVRHDYTWELHTFSSIFYLSLFDFLTWLRYLFFNSVKQFRWYFALIAIEDLLQLFSQVVGNHEAAVIIDLIFASVSNVDTWRRSLSSSRTLFSQTKITFSFQPLSLTAKACFCRITAAFSFQFCSFKFAAAKFCIARLLLRRTMKFPVFCRLITSKFDYYW